MGTGFGVSRVSPQARPRVTYQALPRSGDTSRSSRSVAAGRSWRMARHAARSCRWASFRPTWPVHRSQPQKMLRYEVSSVCHGYAG